MPYLQNEDGHVINAPSTLAAKLVARGWQEAEGDPAAGDRLITLSELQALEEDFVASPKLNPMAYYGSADGGYTAFGLGSGYVSIPAGTGEYLCCLVNPADSGKDMRLDIGEFSSDADTKFHRWGVATTGLSNLANARTPVNLAGASTTSAARMYTRGNFTPTGGVESKVAHIRTNQTYFTELRGRSRLRPGRAIYWTIDGKGQGSNAVVYFEWWEEPAVT